MPVVSYAPRPRFGFRDAASETVDRPITLFLVDCIKKSSVGHAELYLLVNIQKIEH